MRRLAHIFVGLALGTILVVPDFLVSDPVAAMTQDPGANAQEVEKSAQEDARDQSIVERGSGKRDPFTPLVRKDHAGNNLPKNLPPGPEGLLTGTMRVDGVIRTANGMIAIVSNPQNRTYFIREGQQIYNGRIERITMEGLVIQETGKDPFGRPVSRQIFKRIYPSAGD